MTTRHLVDPELVELADSFPVLEITDETLAEVRAFSAGFNVEGDASAAGVTREEIYVPGPVEAAEVRCLVYRPVSAEGPLPVYLHLHGGGYIMGSPEGSDLQSIQLASALSCVVVSVDYRLAPEHPWPAGLEDAYAALDHLFRHADAMGIDAARIAIGGESAGGGLAAALALKARDEGDHKVLYQLLVYPMVDDRTAGEQPHDPLTGEYVWRPEHNRYAWAAYLGEADPAMAAPARAVSLKDLPPVWIGVGTLDLFLDENIAYARRLMAAGVATELKVYPSAFHGFSFNPEAAVSKAYAADYAGALARAFNGPA